MFIFVVTLLQMWKCVVSDQLPDVCFWPCQMLKPIFFWHMVWCCMRSVGFCLSQLCQSVCQLRACSRPNAECRMPNFRTIFWPCQTSPLFLALPSVGGAPRRFGAGATPAGGQLPGRWAGRKRGRGGLGGSEGAAGGSIRDSKPAGAQQRGASWRCSGAEWRIYSARARRRSAPGRRRGPPDRWGF